MSESYLRNRELVKAIIASDTEDFTRSDDWKLERIASCMSIIDQLVEEKNPRHLEIGSYANVGLRTRSLTISIGSMKDKDLVIDICPCGRELTFYDGDKKIDVSLIDESRRLHKEDSFDPL